MRKDKDLRSGDRIEPFLDPAPYGGKERGGAYDLGSPVLGFRSKAHA